MPQPATNAWGVRVGAIRWDAWYGHGDTDSTAKVEQALGPVRFWNRLPFFASIGQAPPCVKIDGNHQAIMDREISYAAEMGIDYWAFMHYPPGYDGLDRALNLYLASTRRASVNFSLILNYWSYCFALGKAGPTPDDALQQLVTLINKPGVEISFGNRPTVFVLNDVCTDDHQAETCSPWMFEELTRRSLAQYNTKPYFVFLGWAADPTKSSSMQAYLKLEGLSLYATNPADLNVGNSPVAYAQFAKAIRVGLLDRLRDTGSQMIPFASAGWDPSPRFACNSGCWKDSYGTNHSTVSPSTPEELVDHIRSVIEWTGYHKDARVPFSYPTAPAQKVLIYAWDEFDEGGWLCPTLASDHLSPSLQKWAALKSLLR